MKITLAKVRKQLINDYGWGNMDCENNKFMINELIKDVISIVTDMLNKEQTK